MYYMIVSWYVQKLHIPRMKDTGNVIVSIGNYRCFLQNLGQ
mgnify:CR=1 FL=1